jgi:hypothetical protein
MITKQTLQNFVSVAFYKVILRKEYPCEGIMQIFLFLVVPSFFIFSCYHWLVLKDALVLYTLNQLRIYYSHVDCTKIHLSLASVEPIKFPY